MESFERRELSVTDTISKPVVHGIRHCEAVVAGKRAAKPLMCGAIHGCMLVSANQRQRPRHGGKLGSVEVMTDWFWDRVSCIGGSEVVWANKVAGRACRARLKGGNGLAPCDWLVMAK